MDPERTSPGVVEFSIAEGGPEWLDRVAPLWTELRSHHARMAPAWRDELPAATFEDRKAGLIRKAAGRDGLLVLLAAAGREAGAIGYCICTVAENGRGEIDSLYVTADSRRRGVGRALVSRAMLWLRGRAAGPVVVEVLYGNDEAFRLYERFGFRPRTVVLQRPAESTEESRC